MHWLSHLHTNKNNMDILMYYLFYIPAKIKTILDLHHEIYTLSDISLLFHSDASTFKMPEVTQIRSLYLSHSLYIILKSSNSWQCRLTATYRHKWSLHPNNCLTLQKMRRLSRAMQKKKKEKRNFHIVRHESLFIWSIRDPQISLLNSVVFAAPKSHWPLLN